MNLFPAIDIRAGKVVRLSQGRFDAETIYGDDPLEVARAFEAEGAPWIHVVDLDAARTGVPENRELVAAIAAGAGIPVQAGGGVRDKSSAQALLDSGVQRVVIGTAAIESPGLVEWLSHKYPGRIAVGLDGRNGNVAVHGWLEGGDSTIADVVKYYNHHPVAAFIITDIERDGMLGGPDVRGITSIVSTTDIDVIASGGVATLDDLRLLTAARPLRYKRVAGAIVGKALYEQRFTVAQAVAVCTAEDDPR